MPAPTFDAATPTGADVAVEETPSCRGDDGNPAVASVKVRNPTFDATPAAVIAA